jgi:hypothetical protein
VEEFHKILKSGCRVETCRLQTAPRLIRYVTLTSVIAWRLYWCTYLNRTAPTEEATTMLTTEELAALQTLNPEEDSGSTASLTIGDAIRRIANLGGFLGRRHDGDPGITAIWRGWQRLSDFALMWSLARNGHLWVIASAELGAYLIGVSAYDAARASSPCRLACAARG